MSSILMLSPSWKEWTPQHFVGIVFPHFTVVLSLLLFILFPGYLCEQYRHFPLCRCVVRYSMLIRRVMRLLQLLAVVVLPLGIPATVVLTTEHVDAKPTRQRSAPQRLFLVPFTHVAQNEELAVLLSEFARIEGYNAIVSPALKGQVNGTFDQTNPYEFLASMGAAWQVRWFRQGRTINFYAQQEMQQAFLATSVLDANSLLSMFREAGILSPQLTHKVMRDNNILYVNAPGFYIDQLRQAMSSMEQAQTNRVTMRVFPLKHAWAEDKQVYSNNDTIVTVPGVASILRSMVMGGPPSVTTISRSSAAQSGLLGQGLAAGKSSQASPTPSGASASAPQSGSETVGQEKGGRQSQVSIMADPRVNAVVVTDAQYRMEYYARVIRDLDKPVRLVEIHAAIVDIDSNYQRELGINFQGAADLGGGWTIGGAGGAAAAQGIMPSAGAASDAGLSMSTLYTRGTDFFLTRVKALEDDGVARMLGKPSVLTTDNMQATLENTSTYYISVSGYQATDLFKVETGTVLKVTPHIIPGRQLPDGTILPDAIKLIVTVQDNRNDDASFVVSSTTPQPIKQTKINTQAIVSEGQSLLIAGYYREKQNDSESGVPGLKNIPLVGRLFGSNKQNHARMERLVLITPRILNIEDAPPIIPNHVDDPRFSRSPTEPNYEERVPKRTPVGGCTRRRLDYASSPDVPPQPGEPKKQPPMGEPAQPLYVSPPAVHP